MSRPPTLLGLAALIATLAAAVHAREPTPLYELRDDELPVLDGSLADWRTLFDRPTLTLADLHRWDGPGRLLEPTPDASDLAMEAYVAWHAGSGQILWGIEVWDDVYREGQDPRAYVDADHLTLAVDGDASGGQYYGFHSGVEGECDATVDEIIDSGDLDCIRSRYFDGRQAQRYLLLEPGRSDPRLQLYGDGMRWLYGTPHIQARGSMRPRDGGYVTEAAITPFDSLDLRGAHHSLPSLLRAGVTLRLDLTLCEDDGPGLGVRGPGCDRFYVDEGWRNYGVSGAQPSAWTDSDTWRPFLLVEARERPSVVGAATLGHVKLEVRRTGVPRRR